MLIDDLVIRPLLETDTPAVTAIYAHHVIHGTASFEVEPPSHDEMKERLAAVRRARWPAIAADVGDKVVGYAYATQFRPRPAYAYTCENSIYVDPDSVGRGVGRGLLSALLEAAEASGFRQMVAVVGGAEPASMALHRSLGFREVGRLANVGWKHGRWLDSVYLQRTLGLGSAHPG